LVGSFYAYRQSAAALKIGSALIDGEAVVLNAPAKSNFQAVQASLKVGTAYAADNAFDLLELESEDLSGLPRIERKERLSALIAAGEGTIRYSEYIQGQARSC
jgi:bifunctional non-homologous end joining protein LigD